MDSKKANQLLERVNALHRSLHPSAAEDPEISAIERDLMLSYLRQLYELYLAESPLPASTTTTTPTKTKLPPAEMPSPVAAAETTPSAAPVAPPAAPQTPPSAPAAAPPSAEAPIIRTPLAEAPTTPPPSSYTPPPAPSSFKASHPKLAQLFAQPATKELSERLAQQPLKDLTRALTINNRVQYANTLFGGNSDLMNSVLLRLNQLESMASARPDLEELALEFNWTEEEKIPVAQDFIKLVNRRYV